MTKDAASAVTPRGNRTRGPRSGWLTPTGLILLSLILLLAGAARLTEVTGGALATPQNARFLDSIVLVVTHIMSVTVFSLLGAFQFVPALRRRRGGWHRRVDGILIPAGLLAAMSGMWMAAFYPHPPGDGVLLVVLVVLRLIFGSAMVASIGLGMRAIVRTGYVIRRRARPARGRRCRSGLPVGPAWGCCPRWRSACSALASVSWEWTSPASSRPSARRSRCSPPATR